MEKPKSILWIKRFAILQVILSFLLVGLLIAVAGLEIKNEVWLSFKQGFLSQLASQGIKEYNFQIAGAIAASPLLGMAASILALMAIQRREKRLTYITLVVLGGHILAGLSGGTISLLSVGMFVLLLTKTGKEYVGLSGGRPKIRGIE
ncbi:MAG: hypothetical protein UT55_C0009G0014 [Candidatus Peregrinibacteria bacterium GW2011_GWE2_39_6]|nr:MAG: hypothetical protein UT36_C0014G0014 [Candidatus Peregrinibacteria bacterium GW2011_GWF2_39_17]KKR26382.1 MAG: hypothetical protein UT55_C0009G0014 [Candidatus Peregrinibacteria bacterium GW2011_GWE2_39_6]HCW32530.1 hypothetical protein [Candidatus Peregrinibacteria bacterium]